MAALAAKAMGAVPVKEKQALLEARRQQTKKSKSVLVGSSSRSVTSEQAGESRSADLECNTWLDADSKQEGASKRPDEAMYRSLGRLALQASSTFDGTEVDACSERALGTDHDGSSTSKFCIRQYTEIVRQDRGDLKQSWPLAEEYLRGHIFQGRVQVSLWPPIGSGESALSHSYRDHSTPEGPLPHLFKLEIAFAESGVSEDKPEHSGVTSEEVGLEKESGGQGISSLDLVERRPSEEVTGICLTRTKSFKAGRRISPTTVTDCSGDGEAQERPKKHDRGSRDPETKDLDQLAAAQAGPRERLASRVDAKEVERGAKQAQGDINSIQPRDTGSPYTELGVGGGISVDTDSKAKRYLDGNHPHVSQEKKTVDKSSKAQCLAENVAEIGDRAVGSGKGKVAGTGGANSGAEAEGGPSSIRSTTHLGDSDNVSKRGGEREGQNHGDVVAIEKGIVVSKRRNDDDRIVEERSAKSDGASVSASRTSTKRQSNKACPVCRSFSSMSQTTMNVHIDSCLVTHQQEEHVAEADHVESEPEPEPESSREPNRSSISKPLKPKAQGSKPKRKKRSIADIVANSSTRTLEDSPGKEGARFIGPYSRSTDQGHDSKNLNWVSGNKKKRQPRNVPSRNLNEENDNKRRRLFRLESATEEPKPGKPEKRRLPEKERELTKLKQLRVERSSGPSTSISKSPKGATPGQDGVEAESRRSGARKTGVGTPVSQSPIIRSGPGKGHVTQSNKEGSETDVSTPVVLTQLRATRTTPAQEDVYTEMGVLPAQNLNTSSPGKSHSSAPEIPAPIAAKPRAAKAHLNSGSTGRLACPLPATEKTPKAPWYPPAAMLRSGTMPPVLVTEAGSSTIPEVTSGTTKSPGSSVTAGNLTDTSRIVTAAEACISARKSPRSTTVNTNKGQKGSRLLARESPLATETNDEAKTSSGDPSNKTNVVVEIQSMAECRISKEVDDYSAQLETAVEGSSKAVQQSSSFRGGSRGVSVDTTHESLSIQAKTDALADKGVGNGGVGKAEGAFHSEKERALPEKGRKREESRGVFTSEEESVTAIPCELVASKQGQDLSATIVKEGCSTGASGDTQTLTAGAGRTTELTVPRMRKRGESKAKSKNLEEKANGKGKKTYVGDPVQAEGANLKRGLPNADVTEETSVEVNQRKEDKLKQERQRKEKKRQAVGSAVEPAFKCSPGPVQPAFQNMVVRRVEGVMGQEKVADEMAKKVVVVGQEKGVDLVTSSNNDVASSPTGKENSKDEELTAQVQANSTQKLQTQRLEKNLNNTAQLRFERDSEMSTSAPQTNEVVEQSGATAPVATKDVLQSQSPQTWPLVPQRPVGRKKLQIQRPEETLNNTAHLRFGRDSEVSTSMSQSEDVVGQVDESGSTASGARKDALQSQSPQAWPLVPQRPVGRKKLPIKCAARSVGSANSLAVAAKQAFRAAMESVSPVTVPKPPVGRSRAARQLAKSVPSGKKGAPQVEYLTSEGGTCSPANAVAEPNAKEKSNPVGSTPIASVQQAFLSPSSSWVTNPLRGQASGSIRPERVPTPTFTSWNRTSEPSAQASRHEVVADKGRPVSVEKGSGASRKPLADELHCTETLFSSPQSNSEISAQEKTSLVATTDKLVDNGTRIAERTKDAEIGSSAQDVLLIKVNASVGHVDGVESAFPKPKSPDRTRLGETAPVTDAQGANDRDSREAGRDQRAIENCIEAVCSPTDGGSQKSGRASLLPGKVMEATGQGKTDTPATFQTLEAGLATFTSSMGNAVRLAALTTPKVASTSTGITIQPVRQNNSNPAVGSSRSTIPYRPKTTSTDAGSFQAAANVRPATPTASTLPTPTSFTSLLQSTTLPTQSSAALSLAMQGTRPLQEACADQNELSRAGAGIQTRAPADPPTRASDGLTWASEKQASSSGNDASTSSHVPAGTAFFRPPAEMGGPSKATDAGDKEVSRLPGWMRAAISDPKGGETAAPVTTEAAEQTQTEAVKGVTSSPSPECGEMSGPPVRVRLWGRDVVIPPNEQNTPGNPPAQQSTFGHRSEAQRAVITSEANASCITSTTGLPVSSRPVLQVNPPRPAPPGVGHGVAEISHQITIPVMNAPNSVGSTDAVSVFGSGRPNNHQAENYLSRLENNSQRAPYTARCSREEIRSSRARKGQTSAAQSTVPPEVIIIDDGAESPAKSGDSFAGELTMSFLLDCGALRYLPAAQNGRAGSQLMEVDPSKIPQRLVNHNFNILAELRKIGLVPAPKAVLPASYRHSQGLSLEVPHSNPPPASRAGSDQLPPWLLAEKKRKEAQIAENLIVLDDDDEPPAETVVVGERRPFHSSASPGPGGGSNLSGQSHTTGQGSPTIGTSGNETRVIEQHSTGALRTTAMSMGATNIPSSGRQSPASSHAGVQHLRRGTSSSSRGSEPPATQKSISRTGEKEVSNFGQDNLVREKTGLQTSAGSKEQSAGQTAPGLSANASRTQREDSRTDKEKALQASDIHHEKRAASKAGVGANKSSAPTDVVGGHVGAPSKKGSAQGISILAPTWMSGNNGWPKRGAAAQACKQAVERLKAQILSSPARDGTSQAGAGGVLDFESHMIGQAQERTANFGGNLSSGTSCLQNMSSPTAQAGFRYSSLSSRSGGNHEKVCSPKEAPHNGRGVGQSPTPVALPSSSPSSFPSTTTKSATPVPFTAPPFISPVAAAERDVSSLSKSPSVQSSIRGNQVGQSMAGVQGSEGNQGRSSTQGAKSSTPSGAGIGTSSTPVREPANSEQLSPSFSHLGRSSSSTTLRSRGLVGSKTANEAANSMLARGALQSEQGSLLHAQGTPFGSRLPSSRLSLAPVQASLPTPTTKALLDQVCFTSKAATDTFTREVTNFHGVIEQPTGRITSPQKRVQPSRRKPVSGGEKTNANLVLGASPVLSSATIITSSSSAQSRRTPVFPSSGSSSSTSDQRRQMEAGVIGTASMNDGAPVLGTGTSRTPNTDLPLSPVFGRVSQTSSPSPSSNQGRYTSSNAAIDGGTWNLSSQTEAGDQASGTGSGSGIMPGYRLPHQIARAMGGHTPRPRAATPTTPVANGDFFGHRGNASLEHPFKQKDLDSPPRSRDSEISGHERYSSQSRSIREEKMKEAPRESPKATTTDPAEKIRTKSLNSI